MVGLFAGRRRNLRPAKRHPRHAKRWRNGGRSLGGDRRPQSGIGREHIMVAMAMRTRRWHQGGDLRDQIQWRQHRRRRVGDQKIVPTHILAIQGGDDEYGTMAQIEAIAAGEHNSVGVELLKLADYRHSAHKDQAATVIEVIDRLAESRY